MMIKKILVTGVTGQDGTIISSLLCEDNIVYGMVRQSATPNYWRLKEAKLLDNNNFHIVECDLTDCSGIFKLVNELKPDWIINLGAMSEVGTSFKIPLTTIQVDALGPIHFLEAIRQFSPQTKFYQASTSEMIGNSKNPDGSANEGTQLVAESPYAAAKLFAYNMVNIYRKAYDIFACSSILYNHSSKYRGEYFIERKIGKYVANVKKGINDDYLYLGNLDASRDIGHAEDYMRAVCMMLERDKPDNYIIATGNTYTIKEMLQIAFSYIGKDWHDYVKIDNDLLRPCEVHHLLGDATKARTELNWKPKYNFFDIMIEIIEADLARA